MRGGGLLLLVPLLAAVAFSWTRIIAETDDVPRDADYLAARRILEDQSVPGGPFDRDRDALVILPPWSLRPLTVLGDLAPISGDAIADRPMHRWARLWAIVEPDAADERNALIARRGPPTFARAAGRVVVERWDLPPPSVAYDLAARLPEASVRVTGDGAADDAADGDGACDRRVQRGDVVGWACTKDGLRVTREHLLVTENADYAVWAAPPKAGRLEITWPAVPVGSAIVVTAGFTRDGADNATAPVRLRVLVDGELAGTIMRKPAFLFATDVVDTERFKGRTASVTIAVDSEDNTGAQFALDATVLR